MIFQYAATPPKQHELEVPQASHDVRELFAQVVARSPDAVAVSWQAGEISYQQLDRRSDRVALALAEHGATPGTVVALCTTDALGQIIATLGCLKAGCVFAAIDPSAPEQRVREMVDTLDLQWAIADAAGRTTAAVLPQTVRHRLDLCWHDDAMVAPVCIPRLPDDPCYAYFTSGSTGRPKAILGRTRGLAHFIQWEIGEFQLGPRTRVSQLTNPAFDVYLRDIFAALCAGGCVCLPPAGTTSDPVLLRDWLTRERISLIHCVPSLFRLLMQASLDQESLPELGHVLLAGESLPVVDANRWIGCFGERARLVNLYGPTETTLAKFFHRLPAEPLTTAFVPIGRPIPGAEALLLDGQRQPSSPGEIGELYIRTPYRSLGYCGAGAAGTEAFISHPITGDANDIVYRTGDMARQLPDGSFQFCGRRDLQVKIRGVRVELTDVEAALRQHPRVREAAVSARETAPYDLRLIAYVVLDGTDEDGLLRDELHAHMQQRLPEAMLPARYLVLDSLPLSRNGKLDRGALPAPGSKRPDLAVAYVPPHDAAERECCGAFAEVLGLDRVGRDDNFFELGGNSLSAARIIGKLRPVFGTAEVTTLFAQPTPSSLAGMLRRVEADGVRAPRLPSASRGATGAHGRRGCEPIAIIGMAGRVPGVG